MDPTQLEQALVNLAVNARDAMPEGGKLSIQARNAEVPSGEHDRTAVAPGPYLVISVTDTGTGMDAATRSRLFEPFFTTKPKVQGTGLGLAMVFGAVEQSGGHIDVATKLGAGTTFTLYPRASPLWRRPASPDAGGPSPSSGSSGRPPPVNGYESSTP
jgi:signal transduction histidine kinase